jgi:hypothetical protein
MLNGIVISALLFYEPNEIMYLKEICTCRSIIDVEWDR